MFPDYTACPTNITSSIIKYFDCTAPHASLPILDEILKRKQYRNVILYLCDGLGTALVKEHLSEDSFLRKNFLTSLCSVFPSTTTSATTSFLSGMEPCEHGWLGWDLYFEKEDKIVTMFRNNIKDTSIPAADYDVAETTYPYKRIHEIINETKKKSRNDTLSF